MRRVRTQLFRIRNGAVIGHLLYADEACVTHEKGDRYVEPIDAKRVPHCYQYRLHQQRSIRGPEPHFEVEPRWYEEVGTGGIPQHHRNAFR